MQPLIRTVKVEPYGTANEFNGGGDTIWVRRQGPTSLEELDNTLSHEIGHCIMSKTDCYLAWEQAVNQDMLSVSHYGRLNPSEDFAEFVRLWIGTDQAPDQIASLWRLFPNRMKVLQDAVAKLKS
jgi:hypothetical protein